MSLSSIRAILGSWRKAQQPSPSSSSIDLEAQTSGTQPSLTPPEPTHNHSPPTRLCEQNNTDPVDDFFGATPSTRITAAGTVPHGSRRDFRLSASSTLVGQGLDTPPPYPNRYSTGTNIEHDLPSYTDAPTTEPITLAQYLFKFGFLFPPFWLLGLIILITPLSAPDDFHAHKPESERAELVEVMRRTEVKWAKKCAWALGFLVLLAGMIAAVVVGVWKGRVGM